MRPKEEEIITDPRELLTIAYIILSQDERVSEIEIFNENGEITSQLEKADYLHAILKFEEVGFEAIPIRKSGKELNFKFKSELCVSPAWIEVNEGYIIVNLPLNDTMLQATGFDFGVEPVVEKEVEIKFPLSYGQLKKAIDEAIDIIDNAFRWKEDFLTALIYELKKRGFEKAR